LKGVNKISWVDRVRNEEILQRVMEGNMLQTIKRRKSALVTYCLGTAF